MKSVYLKIGLFIAVFSVFKAWFFSGIITGGDFLHLYSSMFTNRNLIPLAWDPIGGNGMGLFAPYLQWVNTVYAIPINILGVFLPLPWDTVERIGFLFPYLFLCIFSTVFLAKSVFKKNDFLYLSPFIYLLNTYALMLIAGGQIVAVGLAFACFPLNISLFIRLLQQIDNKANKIMLSTSTVLLSLALSLEALFDIRYFYITISTLVLYSLFWLYKTNPLFRLKNTLYCISLLTISVINTVLIHAFWVLPSILQYENTIVGLGSAYTTNAAVKFFSFAKLENTISLLHPNWPENIFGKVYFMRAEFLLLPILAFSSLFLINTDKTKRMQKQNNLIPFFSLLALVGIFLAKGANEPFGELYLWMFTNIPGFNMFRDPTKWYTLVALSYSILIPYSISCIYDWLHSQKKISIFNFQFALKPQIQKYIPRLFVIIVILYLVFLIRLAILGQIGGTLKSTTIPDSYIQLENKVSRDQNFYRTFWLPQVQRFAFFSENHPAISANNFFKVNSPKESVDILKNKKTLTILQESSIKYIIVPYDSMGEIFLTDRKYDEKKYIDTISELDKITTLKKTNDLGKIVTYEVPNQKNHFWSHQSDIKIKYININSTKYKLSIKNAKKGNDLIFSESYDNGWIMHNSEIRVQSKKYNNRFNSFKLPADGSFNVEIYYEPQRWVYIGITISIISLIFLVALLFYLRFANQKSKLKYKS